MGAPLAAAPLAAALWRWLQARARLAPWLLGSVLGAAFITRRLLTGGGSAASRPLRPAASAAPAEGSALREALAAEQPEGQGKNLTTEQQQAAEQVGGEPNELGPVEAQAPPPELDSTASVLQTPLDCSEGDGLFQCLSMGGLPSQTPRGLWRTVRVVPLGAWQQRLAPPEPFDHPHVVQLFSATVCEREQTAHIDCERTDSTVRELVAAGALRGLSAKTRLRLCAELASGLAAVHASSGGGAAWHGMLRDDTCVLVRESDGKLTAKLSEFGVLTSAAAAAARLPHMTAGWWPAEAADLVPTGPLRSFDGKRMDVFGLGCVAASILSADGQHPFGAADQREQRVRDGTPVLSALVHGWPTSLLPFLLRMLGSPASRRPEASEVLATFVAAYEAAPEALPSPVHGNDAHIQITAASSPTPLARAVAAAGGLDNWHKWSATARRAAIDQALSEPGDFDERMRENESMGDYSVSMASFTSQAEADVDDFLEHIAAMAEAPSDTSVAASMLSTGEDIIATEAGETPEEAVDAFLVDLARMIEDEDDSIEETPEEAIDAFLVDLAEMIENEDDNVEETPEEAVDAFLVDLARTIEEQLAKSPVPMTSPAWRIQEEEAEEYLRDVSMREEDSAMSLTRAAMAISSTPSKAAAAAAEVLDQALTDLEVAAVGRVERAAMETAETPTKAALAAADVIEAAMFELGAETEALLRSPVSPEALDQSIRRDVMRWSSPSDAVASPVSRELGARREVVLAEVARRKLSSAGNDAMATATVAIPPTMPPVPAQLRKMVKEIQAPVAEPVALPSEAVEEIVDEASAMVAQAAEPALDEHAVAQSQVENFLSDIKTITLAQAVQHAMKREEVAAKKEEAVLHATASRLRKEDATRALESAAPAAAHRQREREKASELKMACMLAQKYGCDVPTAQEAIQSCDGQVVKATRVLRERFSNQKTADGNHTTKPIEAEALQAEAPTESTVGTEGEHVDDEITPTLRACRGRSGVRRRVAMTKRFTQLKDSIMIDAEGAAAEERGSVKRHMDSSTTSPLDDANTSPLSPRSAADKASRERTRQLGARLLALAKRKPALAKAAEANGLISSKAITAMPTAAARSPSDVETFVVVSAAQGGSSELGAGLRGMGPLPVNKQPDSQQHRGAGGSDTSVGGIKTIGVEINSSARSVTLCLSPAPAKLAALSKSTTAAAATQDENTPTVASQKLGASPVSAQRKGRAVGSTRRRRRALSSIGNSVAVNHVH
jgi:hypothetical protein